MELSNTAECASHVQQQMPAWTAEHGWSIAKWLHKQKAVLASADAAAVIATRKSSNTPANKLNKQAGNQ